MKSILSTVLLITAISAYGQTAKSKSKKSTAPTTPAAKPAAVITIPKDAVLGDDGSYRYTDKQGKKWLYRNTPFGVSRVEETSLPVQQQSPSPTTPDPTVATVVGDTVKFERPSPFGASRWEKKMTDLNDDEKKILENQKSKQQ